MTTFTDRFRTIIAICKKDFLGLLPLVFLVNGLILVETLISKVDMAIQGQIWVLVQLTAPYVSSGAIGLLIISAFQLDTPSSLTHDWLIRPIRKVDLFLSKIFFLFLFAAIPLILIRLIVNIFIGYSFTESLLEASAFKTPIAMVSIPLFVGIGIVSQTTLQALGVVIGSLLLGAAMLIVPALSVPHPDKINFNGFTWLPQFFAFSLLLIGLWLISWFQFQKRDSLKSQVTIGALLLIGIFAFFASYKLPLWPPIFQILSSAYDDVDETTTANIILDSIYSCFPAVTIGNDLYGDAETPQEGIKGLAGLNYFTAWELEAAGPKGIAFSTRVQARNLPRDWRLITVNATATYSTNANNQYFRFSPASGVTPALVNSRSDGTHFWALPEQELERLASDPTTQLTLDLDVAVLSPTKYILEPDNQRRYFPGVGYCSAKPDAIGNELIVDCFKRGPRPTLVSAEIAGIPATRVDATKPNFSPKFLQVFGGQHYRMTISSASLLPNANVLITLFEQKAFVSKQLTTSGILGDDIATCPLPTEENRSEAILAGWSDRSPHQISFLNVNRNVRLEVLEWPHSGGEEPIHSIDNQGGRTLILLAGGGSTAHSFDDIAPRLAEKFRVIAITRRGAGDSSAPSSGYDVPELTNDVIQVMNSLNIESAIFVGHSLAGDELSALGADYPNRVAGLVYLDAAYDRSSMLDTSNGTNVGGIQPPAPRPFREELQSYQAMQSYFDRIGSVGSTEGSFMSSFDFSSGTRTTDPRIGQAILVQLESPRYENISAPVVAIYAVEETDSLMKPWFDPKDELLRKNVEEQFHLRTNYRKAQIEVLERSIPQAKVIEIVGADHAVFISHEDEVVETILNLADSLNE